MPRKRNKKDTNKPPRTLEHLLSHQSGPDKIISPPDIVIPKGRFPSRRLSWQHFELKDDITHQIVNMIKAPANRDVAWMLDANLFIAETPIVVWEELFATRNVVIPSPIMHELAFWLNDPRVNIAAHQVVTHARDNHSQAAMSVFNPPSDPKIASSMDYYIRLSGLRKHSFLAAVAELQTKLGREPTNQEVSNWCKDKLGQRTQLLTGKGRKAFNSPNIFNDEAFVIMGILYALFSTKETMLITRDEDVFEQFYKSIYLIDTHFRGMLLADHYLADPFQFFERVVVTGAQKAFDGEVKLLRKPSDTLHELLPHNFETVGLHCLFLRSNDAIQLSFSADLGFQRLFQVKGETKGLSTNQLNGANSHVTLGPLMKDLGDFAAIGQDRSVITPNGLKLSILDCNLSANSQETTRGNITSQFAF